MKKLLLMSLIILAAIAGCKKDLPMSPASPSPPPKPGSINRSPVALAGQDKVLVFPPDSVLLDGSGSYDPEGKITQYKWTKILGPAAFYITYPDSAKTIVRGMVEGVYAFQLTVTDDKGASAEDTVQITVQKQSNGSSVDIYVSGEENTKPCYWKNGVKHTLNTSSPGSHITTGIAVSGTDVYVSGGQQSFAFPTEQTTAKYWKNGNEVVLGKELYSSANSIAMVNNDVYVAGSESRFWDSGFVAKYWKNGQAVSLTNGTTNAAATCIYVVNGDMYVAGHEGGVAKYWKNGQAVSLTNGSTIALAMSIVVDDDDVYVAGYEGNVAKYWKNGQAVSLTSSLYESYASSITVVGNDVYVAGREGYETVRYWKNGLPVSFYFDYGTASSICVLNNDVYVAGTGYVVVGGAFPLYWKNGQAQELAVSGSSSGIVVVPR